MLCSNCYKKIPEGEEIKKGSGLGPWGWTGGGSKVVCRKCAKDDEKKNRIVWGVFIGFFLIWLLLFLFFLFFTNFFRFDF